MVILPNLRNYTLQVYYAGRVVSAPTRHERHPLVRNRLPWQITGTPSRTASWQTQACLQSLSVMADCLIAEIQACDAPANWASLPAGMAPQLDLRRILVTSQFPLHGGLYKPITQTPEPCYFHSVSSKQSYMPLHPCVATISPLKGTLLVFIQATP